MLLQVSHHHGILDNVFHTPLLPVYPVARAKCRLMIYRIERDWYSLLHKIEANVAQQSETAKEELKNSLLAANAYFCNFTLLFK